MKRILLIDDDMDMCKLLSQFLQRKGFETDTAYTGTKGVAKFKENAFDVVLCDFRLGDKDGREVLKEIKAINPAVIVIIITGYSDVKMAVEVIRHGAFDYITKPLIPEEVINVIRRGLENPLSADSSSPENTPAENGVKRVMITTTDDFLTGVSPYALELYKQVELVAPTNYSVIIYGESGTGKEVIARTIHNMSQRHDKPFVAMDCGTLSKELAGSELFGHVKGAFTGALQDKEGHFESANGGTLFLDEVGNLSVEVQATLLRVIQERRFRRVGGNKEMEVDVRLIVASNENLQEAYRKGKFREDLYHRFNEFSINLPSLRNRKEDIIPLTEFFLAKATAELNKDINGIDDGVLQTFLQYSWPGNLREFRNVIRRAVLLTNPGGMITSDTMPWEISSNGYSTGDTTDIKMASASPVPSHFQTTNGHTDENKDILREAAGRAEYEAIMAVLQQVNFNKKKAAELLKIDRKTLYNKIKSFQPLNKF